jgi:hypothetical protein
MNVFFQRERVAVIELDARGLGDPLVGKGFVGIEHPGAILWDAVHLRVQILQMRVNRMRVPSNVFDLTRMRSPSTARSVGPGTCPLKAQASNSMPGAI